MNSARVLTGRLSGIAVGVALAVAVVAVIGFAVSLRSPDISGAAAPSDTARDWCLADGPTVPDAQIRDVGTLYLGMEYYSEDQAPDSDDPGWEAACALAYELWGLSTDEWEWCFGDEVRATILTHAVSFLGMGEDEAAGTELFTEAPGDDPAEYTQACRFAYRFWRQSPAGVDPGLAAREHFGVEAETNSWCEANPTAIGEARALLGLREKEPGTMPAVVAEARACRFASLVADGRAIVAQMPRRPSPAPTSAPPAVAFEALVVNRTASAFLLSDMPADGARSQAIPACSAIRINGESRILPWSFGYARAELSDDGPPIAVGDVHPVIGLESVDPDGTDRVGVEIVFSEDGTTVVEKLPVGDIPEGDLCE